MLNKDGKLAIFKGIAFIHVDKSLDQRIHLVVSSSVSILMLNNKLTFDHLKIKRMFLYFKANIRSHNLHLFIC